jgi:hypothetical protein
MIYEEKLIVSRMEFLWWIGMLIGPRGSISMGVLEAVTNTFTGRSPRATAARRVRDMNEATDHALFPFSAEWLFLQKF